MPDVASLLAAHPFFKDMTAAQQKVIAECGKEVQFQADQYIFKENDTSDSFYAILAGHVSVEIAVPGGGALVIQTVGPGEILGWSWLVAPYKKRFDARVLAPTQALKIDARCLRTKCEADPLLGYDLMKRTAQTIGVRLQQTRHQLLDAYRRQAD
ncbi:MAG: cyclic nucleotide-binding domain-containing protein [Candidatus Omnitrophica bacterium]|nr:cyclic nucleotide-binding domain-containing protein [Candidatus Omnitrophota bacterium]